MIFYLYYLLLCSWIKIWNEIWIRVSIRKTFAQFLRNETQNFFFLCASVLREKTTICAIIRKSHFAQNCHIPLLQNSSFAQFRNFIKIKRLVTVCFLEFNSGKVLFWNVFLWSLLHNWPMTVKKSSNLTIFSTILVLDMHIS